MPKTSRPLTALERATDIASRLPERFASTSDALAAFDESVQKAQLQNPVNRRAPGVSVARVVYPLARSPRTPGEAKLVEEMRNGYDPNTGQRFSTVSEGREYLRQNNLTQMSARDFLNQFGGIDKGGMTSTKSPHRQALDTNVKGYNPEAFEIGQQAIQSLGLVGR